MEKTYQQPETGIGSVAETNRLLSEASKQTGLAAPTFSPTGAITSQVLSGNATPYQLPPPPAQKYQPPVNVPVPSGTITGETGVATLAPPQPQSTSKSFTDSLKEQFTKLGDVLGTKAEETKRIQEETQLAQKRESQAKSYNAYIQAKQDLEAQVQKLAGAGLSDAQRVAQEKEIRRVGNANVSNLAFQALADQNLLSAAEQTVKDKIDAQFSPITEQIDFLTKMSTVLSNDLSESESLQLQSQIEEKKTGRDNITKTAEALHQNMIANGAPPTTYSALDKISEDYIAGRITAQEAQSRMYQAAGQYGVKPLTEKEKLENQKLRKEISEITPSGIVIARDASGNPVVTPQAQALQTILGSGKFTKDQVRLVTNAINNGEDPFTVIRNQGKALMSGTNQTKVESYETAQQAMNDLKSALTQYYANNGKTSYLSGNFEKVVNKLGEVKDPKLVELATQIQTQLQVYRNAVSGTAYSVQEGADIASIFPGINKSKGLNDAIIKGREAAFNSAIDGAYRGVLGSAYDKLKTEQTPLPPAPPTTTSSGKPFDVAGAKAAGYTDQDIYDYLKNH